MFATKLSFVQC